MGARYEQITEADLDQLLADFKRLPDRRSSNPEREVSFDWLLPPTQEGPRRAVRLYTSLYRGIGRAKGEDAIRVVFVLSPGAPSSERVVGGLRRVHRTPGWQQRVRERLILAWQLLAKAPACPACGAPMLPVPRRARQGRKILNVFWGCVRYPNCRGTRRGVKGDHYEELLSS